VCCTLQTQITKEDVWIRTYGRLYQKLCSTTCEIPIGIYRTQDSQTETDESYYDDTENSDATNKRYSSTGAQHGSIGGVSSASSKMNNYRRCFRGACGSSTSSFTSAALTVNDEARDSDSHAQLIERAEIANLVRSRMQSLGLPCNESDLQFSEKRNSLSYVIINPSCDLKLKEGDIIYLIRPSPFSATKTFERHNSRRKSTLNPIGNKSSPSGGGGPSSNAEELHKASLTLFRERGGPRRRSSSGEYRDSRCREGVAGFWLSLTLTVLIYFADSPRLRTNSLRVCPSDDILLRRSNSLRQGLGSPRRPHDEIGLPLISKAPSCTVHRTASLGINGAMNVEISSPPEEDESRERSSLQGTIV